jgi:hypothetical protein
MRHISHFPIRTQTEQMRSRVYAALNRIVGYHSFTGSSHRPCVRSPLHSGQSRCKNQRKASFSFAMCAILLMTRVLLFGFWRTGADDNLLGTKRYYYTAYHTPYLPIIECSLSQENIGASWSQPRKPFYHQNTSN